MKNTLIKLYCTWFGAGLSPKAPGTMGSIAALPFAWGIAYYYGSLALLAAALAVFVIGVPLSTILAKELQTDDPQCIVVDEVAGQWLALAAAPLTWQAYLLGFMLFRLFDITKPFPVSWADQKLQGGWGIMLDDIFAGVYAWILLQGVLLWIL
jgi:phosphatidylglycerophosphatase A